MNVKNMDERRGSSVLGAESSPVESSDNIVPRGTVTASDCSSFVNDFSSLMMHSMTVGDPSKLGRVRDLPHIFLLRILRRWPVVDGLHVGFLPVEHMQGELFVGEKGIWTQNDPILDTCSKRRGIWYYLGRREGGAAVFLLGFYPRGSEIKEKGAAI